MQLTPYDDVDELLSSLLGYIQQIQSQKLVGLYLYGSLIINDFDRESSDIDLLVVTSAGIEDQEFDQTTENAQRLRYQKSGVG